jgi:hypothetical protein
MRVLDKKIRRRVLDAVIVVAGGSAQVELIATRRKARLKNLLALTARLISRVPGACHPAISVNFAHPTTRRLRRAALSHTRAVRLPVHGLLILVAARIPLRLGILHCPSQHHDYNRYLQNGKDIAFHRLPLP